MIRLHRRAVLLAFVCLVAVGSVVLAQEPNLTEDQIREFLLKANIVDYHRIPKGVTSPWRLTLSDGTLTHDAAFQSIDEFRPSFERADGTKEIGFRDSYHFNIAAYELAKLLGLGDMMPVTVERKWRGSKGSLSWWLPVKMDEQERRDRKLEPPDLEAWNMQMDRMWVFSELVYDTDRNLTNMLIGENWKLWMIGFSRAFRRQHTLENPACLVMCDRHLLEKLRQLDEAVVMEKTKPHLNTEQVKAVIARRDLIVSYFDTKVTEKGEKAVLY
jgi:hypothetical protein